MSIEFKASNFHLLEEAIKSLGYTPRRTEMDVSFLYKNSRVQISNGKIYVDSDKAEIIDQLKKQYSLECVKTATAKYGWLAKQTATNKLAVTRRG